VIALFALTAACSSHSSTTNASIGVADCDQYVSRMNACMAKDPRMKAMEPGFRAQQDAWKQMAKTNAATVQSNCKAALESLAKNPTCQ
jgi:hypothetical protein